MRSTKFLVASIVIVHCLRVSAEEPSATRAHNDPPAPPRVSSDGGTIRMPAFDFPFSSFASREAREALAGELAKRDAAPPWPEDTDIKALRQRAEDDFIQPMLRKQQARWSSLVDIEPREIAGVYTEIFTPKGGIAPANKHRVLINVHGGGFTVGARTHGQLESLPIAATGRIKVISIDYRMAPEHNFPAASEDVAAVYQVLLRDYKPQNVGLYGCSAGGMLTAQATAWLIDKGVPVPGAIGMFGSTGEVPWKGDSVHLSWAYEGGSAPQSEMVVPPYFKGADLNSPLVSPMLSTSTLRRFPTSLLLSGGRGPEASSLMDANNKLALAGVKSRLHLWDGLGHCFYLNADLPESHEAEKIIVDFFEDNLGR